MMTLEEAIKHAEDKSNTCTDCGMEHKQLAMWLRELEAFKMISETCVCPICGQELPSDDEIGWHDVMVDGDYITSICPKCWDDKSDDEIKEKLDIKTKCVTIY